MTIAGVAILLLFAMSIFRGFATRVAADAAPGPSDPAALAATATAAAALQAGLTTPVPGPVATPDVSWSLITAPPYDEYFLTQGLHGESYGHLAIDIAAGNGSVIKSIINGTVTATGYDQWGNTFIQIDNDVYTVLYLHGAYSLVAGDAVTAGQPIGTESNIGYTLDLSLIHI